MHPVVRWQRRRSDRGHPPYFMPPFDPSKSNPRTPKRTQRRRLSRSSGDPMVCELSGRLWRANRVSTKPINTLVVASASGLSAHIACTASPHFSSGLPNTNASATARCSRSTCSTSVGWPVLFFCPCSGERASGGNGDDLCWNSERMKRGAATLATRRGHGVCARSPPISPPRAKSSTWPSWFRRSCPRRSNTSSVGVPCIS